MKTLLGSIAIGIGALLCHGVYAQDSAGHTALCKDGTYFDGTTHKGACRGHQGVKEWLDKTAAKGDTTSAADDGATGKKASRGKSAAAAATTAAAPATSISPAETPAATTATAKQEAPSKRTPPTPAKNIVAKPGGGTGLVWVNAESKVYHCQSDEWYGKTKQGSYMSVADAEKAGAHPARGKACQ
jgi:hypothetical protein